MNRKIMNGEQPVDITQAVHRSLFTICIASQFIELQFTLSFTDSL